MRMRVSVRTLKLPGPLDGVAIYSPTKRADNTRACNYIRERAYPFESARL